MLQHPSGLVTSFPYYFRSLPGSEIGNRSGPDTNQGFMNDIFDQYQCSKYHS